MSAKSSEKHIFLFYLVFIASMVWAIMSVSYFFFWVSIIYVNLCQILKRCIHLWTCPYLECSKVSQSYTNFWACSLLKTKWTASPGRCSVSFPFRLTPHILSGWRRILLWWFLSSYKSNVLHCCQSLWIFSFLYDRIITLNVFLKVIWERFLFIQAKLCPVITKKCKLAKYMQVL